MVGNSTAAFIPVGVSTAGTVVCAGSVSLHDAQMGLRGHVLCSGVLACGFRPLGSLRLFQQSAPLSPVVPERRLETQLARNKFHVLLQQSRPC